MRVFWYILGVLLGILNERWSMLAVLKSMLRVNGAYWDYFRAYWENVGIIMLNMLEVHRGVRVLWHILLLIVFWRI